MIQLGRGLLLNVDEIQMAPDGKIVGATVYRFSKGENRLIRHLFFLDVETGRTKVVKAEGEENGKKWSASVDLRDGKKIGLIGGWHHIKTAQSAEVSFNEIPDNLSTLFNQGGE